MEQECCFDIRQKNLDNEKEVIKMLKVFVSSPVVQVSTCEAAAPRYSGK